jgi:hypothetical protein
MDSVCVVVQLRVSANDIIILSVAQQCFYGKFTYVATLQIIHSNIFILSPYMLLSHTV